MAGSSPWYKDGLAFDCQRCGGCCGGFPGYVWVTEGDITAMAAHLGTDREEFERLFVMRVGSRKSLREGGNWNCVMLENGLCRAYPVRPAQCRTFPFWQENLRSSAAWERAARRCPGVNRGQVWSLDEIGTFLNGSRIERPRSPGGARP